MDMYAITAEHPLLGILRNVPLEKTIDYADAAVRGGVLHYFPRVHGVLPQEIRRKPPAPGPAQNVAG